MTMELLDTLPVGPFQCNCSLVACTETKAAVLIDPGDEPERILEMVKHHGVDVKALIHTHAHLDHVGATRAVKEALGCPICLHRGDQWLYDNLQMQGSMFNFSMEPPLPIDRHLEHQDQIDFGRQHFQVLHTPGHTPGSICFYTPVMKSFLFSGDTLFRRSIGRTDLWGGDFRQIIHSIQNELMTLDPDTVVLPGHGPATTVGDEQRKNPFLTGS